jgi:hypothetical protein
MTDEEKAAAEKAEAEKKAAEEAEAAKKPPWGSDDEFDPKRAWKLITDLRDDLGKLKSERDEAKGKVKEHEDSTKSDQDKLTESKTAAEKRADEAEQNATRLRVAMEHGLDKEDLDLLGSGDEEQIEARAKRLAERSAPPDDTGQEPRRRPQERLRPGAAPSADPEKSDPASLAEQVPRGY